MDHSTGSPKSQEPNPRQDDSVQTIQSHLDSVEMQHKDDTISGRKRKHSSAETGQVGDQRLMTPLNVHDENADGALHDNGLKSPGQPKKPKLVHTQTTSDRSQLPMEIWHYIFSFLDPKTLGTLLRVNKIFHSFLTSRNHASLGSSSLSGVLRPVSSSSIWSSARKLYHSGMPRPLASLTELDMWRLIGTMACDVCGKNNSTSPSPAANPTWENGPGNHGVRIFWPFAMRTCSECFLKYTKKDVEVVLSSLPTFLLPGLSFVLITPSMHMISSVALRSNDTPTDIQLTKFYLISEIEYLMQEFDHVKSLGQAALEEWIKGLESKGKRKMADAARWEQWESSGGLDETRLKLRGRISNNAPDKECLAPNISWPGNHSLSAANQILVHRGVSSASPKSASPEFESRGGRSLREVDEAKASRRAEIERRCSLLHPPLTAAVLSHMESFSAAIQIPHELTDKDWEYLKPRLLAQRELAENKENDRLKESQLLQAKTEERRQQEAREKQDKESLDRQWDDAQRLIQDQISIYADEIIEKNGNSGTTLTKDKCAQFAADVLINVRTRFYNRIREEDAVARASGVVVKADSPNEPPTRKLILENMKWIFDTKIKPLTEKYSKEIFLCNGCENTSRYYGFEGVVQHYAAKHTSALSFGNIVVFWRAEWPEKPPFHPNPNTARALMHASSQGGFGQPPSYRQQQNQPQHQGSSALYMGTPEQRHGILSESHPSSRTFGRSPFRSPYTAYMQGPFQPPSPRTSPHYSGYGFQPPSPAMEASAFDPSPAYSSPYHPHVVPVNYQAHFSQAPHPYPSPAYASISPANQGLLYKLPHGGNRNSISHHKDAYQTQLDHMARVAREVWNATSGIKDLPNSIRAHVLIYHVAVTTQHQFNVDASIALFADGLNNHPQMKPMRGLNGLVCKCCAAEDPRDLGLHSSRPYAFSALISHFQSMHMEQHIKSGSSSENANENRSNPDWKTDMIALPDLSSIKSLPQQLGMDDFKLRIIGQAVPEAFQSPLPALPAETFMIKRSPATYHAYVDRPSNYSSPTLYSLKKGSPLSSAAEPHAIPTNSGPIDSLSGETRFLPHSLARRGSPNVFPRDGRGNGSRNSSLAGSPRAVLLRSPRYIRLQEDWVYREDDADEVSSEHHDRFYIPVSARSTISDRADYSYKQVSSEQFESEMPAEHHHHHHQHHHHQQQQQQQQQQQRIERRSTLSRRTGHSEGTLFPKTATPLTSEHEDSRSNAGDISAAEHFLNNFVPGQETPKYQSDGPSSDIRNESSAPIPNSDRPWGPTAGAGDDVSERAYYGPDEWKRWNSSGNLVRAHEHPRDSSRAEWTVSAAAQRTRASPDLAQLRYGRKISGAVESKMPPSRFDRYEALRQESLRPRSRSPSIVKEDLPHDVLYFEDQESRLPARLPPPSQHQHSGGDRYSRLEREPVSNAGRRNVAGYRAAGAVRDPVYYDETMEY